jgi:hypothetical protein
MAKGAEFVMLVLSLVLGIVPLLAIAWAVIDGWLFTVDGLFMSLIMLTLSAIAMLNAMWEARSLGYLNFLHKKAPAQPAKK